MWIALAGLALYFLAPVYFLQEVAIAFMVIVYTLASTVFLFAYIDIFNEFKPMRGTQFFWILAYLASYLLAWRCSLILGSIFLATDNWQHGLVLIIFGLTFERVAVVIAESNEAQPTTFMGFFDPKTFLF